VKPDVILVGGGLANCLIALRLADAWPDIEILLLEREAALGGNHTWSFHGSDVSPTQLAWLAPLCEQSWSAYEVRFPSLRRRIEGSYHSINSANLHAAVRQLPTCKLLTNAAVHQVTASAVVLDDGRRFEASLVLDGRGDPGTSAFDVCFQKFVGQVVSLSRPHGLEAPILMDALVQQRDGYRFFYTLPLAPDRLLIEDTRYSEQPALARGEMRAAIADYAQTQGWVIDDVLREEEGVLPVVLDGDIDAFWSADFGVPRTGMRAGLFNFTTGYSLPEAVRCAELVANSPRLDSASLYSSIRARSEQLWRRGWFLRMLNRMLFRAAEPEERYRVLQHFYRLPQATVNRLYAGVPTWPDRMRILSGRPPVPVGRALTVMWPGRTTTSPDDARDG